MSGLAMFTTAYSETRKGIGICRPARASRRSSDSDGSQSRRKPFLQMLPNFLPRKAQQGARANTTGCHGSCSEQHAPRQPVVWLTYDVRQKKCAPALIQYIDSPLQSQP